MSESEFERLLTALSDPERDDGPELPVEEQSDPDDVGIWAIWEGGPIKWNHDSAAARADRAWRCLRERGLRPELGEGMFPEAVVETVNPSGEWEDAL